MIAPKRVIQSIQKVIANVGIKDTGGSGINPAIKEQFTPIEKAAIHGTAETANTDILAADLSPTNTPCLFRAMVMLETEGVFSAILKRSAVSKKLACNNGDALLADCVYIFDILVHEDDTVNFQTSASGNVTMRVQEIVAGVQ